MYSRVVVEAQRKKVERHLGKQLREFSIAEVDEFKERIRILEKKQKEKGPIPLAALPKDIFEYIANEQRMCFLSFRYFLERYAYIVTDTGRLERFSLWPSQLHFLKKIASEELESFNGWTSRGSKGEFKSKVRLVVVKSRQVGATRFGQGVGAHLTYIFPHTRSVVASETPEKTTDLWRLWDSIHSNLPYWMQPERDGRVKGQELNFPSIGSALHTGAGNQKNTLGQGLTVDFFHITEVSTWLPEVAALLDEDLFWSFDSSQKHHSLGIIESTAAGGRGNWFYEQYQAAKKPNSLFKPLFLGWFLCPDKWAIPAENVVLTAQTEAIGRQIEQDNPLVKLTKEQLAWYQSRREEMENKGKLSKFLQEVPSSADEAFQYGVDSIFPIEVVEKVRLACPSKPFKVGSFDFEQDRLTPCGWNGSVEEMDQKLILWEEPKRGFLYSIGIDASHGVMVDPEQKSKKKSGPDSTAFEVVRLPSIHSQEVVQVAEWRGTVSPSQVYKLALKLGFMFEDKVEKRPALIAPESNPGSPSAFCTQQLIEKGYPNIYLHRDLNRVRGDKLMGKWGWQTNANTRPALLNRGIEGLETGLLRVSSLGVVDEMRTLVKKISASGQGKIEHAEGYHDDRLIALFIAYWTATEESAVLEADRVAKYIVEKDAPKVRRPELWEWMGDPEEWMDTWEEMYGFRN